MADYECEGCQAEFSLLGNDAAGFDKGLPSYCPYCGVELGFDEDDDG